MGRSQAQGCLEAKEIDSLLKKEKVAADVLRDLDGRVV